MGIRLRIPRIFLNLFLLGIIVIPYPAIGFLTMPAQKSNSAQRRFFKPLQFDYMNSYYNPFWYGGPLDGGDLFDAPFGGFAPNPFTRPTAPLTPKSDPTTTPTGSTSTSTSSPTLTQSTPSPVPSSQPPLHPYPSFYHSDHYDWPVDSNYYDYY